MALTSYSSPYNVRADTTVTIQVITGGIRGPGCWELIIKYWIQGQPGNEYFQEAIESPSVSQGRCTHSWSSNLFSNKQLVVCLRALCGGSPGSEWLSKQMSEEEEEDVIWSEPASSWMGLVEKKKWVRWSHNCMEDVHYKTLLKRSSNPTDTLLDSKQPQPIDSNNKEDVPLFHILLPSCERQDPRDYGKK